VGLRGPHIDDVIKSKPNIDWFEILIDNYLSEKSSAHEWLDLIAQRYAVVFHCVGMSVAGVDPVDLKYLSQIKKMIEVYKAKWVSDHLCWTHHQGHYHHDLLPFPYTRESLEHVRTRVLAIQEFLGAKVSFENISRYIKTENEMSELEFLSELSQKTGCGILLDINNLFVNAHNLNEDPMLAIKALKASQITQIHLGGHGEYDDFLIDHHGAKVSNQVWQLFQKAITYFGPIPTSIEWDQNLPEWEVLYQESQRAKSYLTRKQNEH
jgi:uncharacterized protein (UPF0276 family)